MALKNIIVIGASTGGFEALRRLVEGLPSDLKASIFIVWHMSPDVQGILPKVLDNLGGLPVTQALDQETIEVGHIYVAAPDRHLLLEDDHIRVTNGPKENRFRPAVDPLFRSAAFIYGPRVVGIVLTGGLDDGASGLLTIKQLGGTTVVQDPSDAEAPSMPESAIRQVKIDYKVTLREMPDLITRLVSETAGDARVSWSEDERHLLEMEIAVAMQEEDLERKNIGYGELSPFTCPECRGVLSYIRQGSLLRYRCHTGHAYSVDGLLSGLTETAENALWSAIRALKESVLLLNHMGDHLAEENQPRLAALYFNKAKEAEARMHRVWQVVSGQENLSVATMHQELSEERPPTLSTKS